MIENIILILISVAIALILATLIIILSIILPNERKKPKKVEEILDIAPHRDCGACSYPNCEAYAKAISEDPSIIKKHKCPFMFKDSKKIDELEKILDYKIKNTKSN